ncbi:MAG: FAD-dependent oxidoreductase [Candidatus Sumerlaeota bacterium]
MREWGIGNGKLLNPEAFDIPFMIKKETSSPPATLLVVGGGVIGLGCALQVAAQFPTMRIIISDAPTHPAVASRAAAGMLAPYAEFDADSKLFQLCRESFEYYPEFLRTFELDAKLIDCGILIPASGEDAAEAEENARLASRYVEVNWLEGTALRDAEPALQCRRALHIPGSIINPRHLHDAMIASAKRAGIELVPEKVMRFERDGGRIVAAILQNDDRIVCDYAIIASGAWSKSLGELAGIDLPMIPVKGQIVNVAAPDGFIRHMIHSHEIYLAPREGEGVIIGATMEENNFDESILSDISAQLIDLAAAHVPAIRNFPIAESWCGFRPKLPNGEPLIAWQGENILIATGHYRNGILLTPITGKIIAELLCLRLS